MIHALGFTRAGTLCGAAGASAVDGPSRDVVDCPACRKILDKPIPPRATVTRMATTCSVPGCTKPARAAGQCTSHYQRARRLARGESAPELEQPLRDRDRPKVFARVARATKARIDAEAKARGIPPYRVTAEVLDGWAKGRS